MNCPTRDSWYSKCTRIGHWGPKCCHGKPPQPKNEPPPRNAPPTGSQCGKSRCPPGSHSCHPCRGDKTDTIDLGEDHSPQDKIVLYGIQANATTIATTHGTVNTKGSTHIWWSVNWCDQLWNHRRLSPREYSGRKCLCPMVQWSIHHSTASHKCPAVRKQPPSTSKSTLELEVMCYPSIFSNVSTQTGSAQLACPLAWIMLTPG